MVAVEKDDFIEIEFVGKIKETQEVFDTNSKNEIEKRKLNFKAMPYIVCIGENMSIKGLDKELEGKEIGQDYYAEFSPEEAFGKRNPSLVRMIPLKVFINQKIVPRKGMQLALDGAIAKVISISSGRVLVDFNNPLAGKTVSYNYKIIRRLEDEKDKINALQDFFFKRRFSFSIVNNEVCFRIEEQFRKFIETMANPFGNILGMKIKMEVINNNNKDIINK